MCERALRASMKSMVVLAMSGEIYRMKSSLCQRYLTSLMMIIISIIDKSNSLETDVEANLSVYRKNEYVCIFDKDGPLCKSSKTVARRVSTMLMKMKKKEASRTNTNIEEKLSVSNRVILLCYNRLICSQAKKEKKRKK